MLHIYRHLLGFLFLIPMCNRFAATNIDTSAAPPPRGPSGNGQAGAAAAAAAAAAVLAAQTDPAPASGLTRFSAQHFQPADARFPPAQAAGSAPLSSFAEGAGSTTDFVAVGTSCILPPPAPWHVSAGRRGRLLLLRLQPPGQGGSRQGDDWPARHQADIIAALAGYCITNVNSARVAASCIWHSVCLLAVQISTGEHFQGPGLPQCYYQTAISQTLSNCEISPPTQAGWLLVTEAGVAAGGASHATAPASVLISVDCRLADCVTLRSRKKLLPQVGGWRRGKCCS